VGPTAGRPPRLRRAGEPLRGPEPLRRPARRDVCRR
jgi:hypothetical protein